MFRDMYAEFWGGVSDALRRYDKNNPPPPQKARLFDPVEGPLYSSYPDPRIKRKQEVEAFFYRARVARMEAKRV